MMAVVGLTLVTVSALLYNVSVMDPTQQDVLTIIAEISRGEYTATLTEQDRGNVTWMIEEANETTVMMLPLIVGASMVVMVGFIVFIHTWSNSEEYSHMYEYPIDIPVIKQQEGTQVCSYCGTCNLSDSFRCGHCGGRLT